MRMQDARDMFAYAQDPEVSRHVLWEAHRNIGQSRQFLRAAIRQGILQKPIRHHLTERPSDTPRNMNQIGG